MRSCGSSPTRRVSDCSSVAGMSPIIWTTARWCTSASPLGTHLAEEIDQAVSIFSDHGAKVVLFTMPYIDPPQTATGTIYPENSPARVAEFNQILSGVRPAERKARSSP